jgi:hypothetical protein
VIDVLRGVHLLRMLYLHGVGYWYYSSTVKREVHSK